MNLKTFGKKVGKDIKKNLPKILVCGSIAGMVTSVVFAVKATPKAMILLDEKKQELGTEKLDVKTIVKTAAPAYIPTAISMVASAGCIYKYMDEPMTATWFPGEPKPCEPRMPQKNKPRPKIKVKVKALTSEAIWIRRSRPSRVSPTLQLYLARPASRPVPPCTSFLRRWLLVL